MVDVEYSWISTKFARCDQLGHKESRCLQQSYTKLRDLPQASRAQSFAPALNVETVYVPTSVSDYVTLSASGDHTSVETGQFVPLTGSDSAYISTTISAYGSASGSSSATIINNVPSVMVPLPLVQPLSTTFVVAVIEQVSIIPSHDSGTTTFASTSISQAI